MRLTINAGKYKEVYLVDGRTQSKKIEKKNRVGFYGTATQYRLYGAITGEKFPDLHPIYIEIKNMGYKLGNLTPAGKSELQTIQFQLSPCKSTLKIIQRVGSDYISVCFSVAEAQGPFRVDLLSTGIHYPRSYSFFQA